jgi:hypothetical protein
MSDKIHEEVIESWNSWKYDILDMNRSTWSKDDQLTLETIDQILRDELNKDIEITSLKGQVRVAENTRAEEIMALYAEVKRLKNEKEVLETNLYKLKKLHNAKVLEKKE